MAIDEEDNSFKIQDKKEEGNLALKQRISSNLCFYFYSPVNSRIKRGQLHMHRILGQLDPTTYTSHK